MSAHTPGPWELVTVQTACGICHKIGPFPPKREGGAARYACLYADYPSQGNPADAELEANARLISAAPDMYEALKEVLRVADANGIDAHYSRAVYFVRAALAKAGRQ